MTDVDSLDEMFAAAPNPRERDKVNMHQPLEGSLFTAFGNPEGPLYLYTHAILLLPVLPTRHHYK